MDFVVDYSIEKGRFEIELINKKSKDKGDPEKNAYGCVFCDGCKSNRDQGFTYSPERRFEL